ncbi:hypothetical protein M378DRAFT_71959 [Amanita muscaria Koide BX008]|uniref:Alpha/beta-hydrolase n=1 Tax=Amanita muscaria (strain Koide BX008) TaxID=946122 RepID=A0A0C2XFI0_AMAMK|nr:hypothetical protein M378DRAFT_71959 [Amanita muscaria Koide BX008]
MPFVDISTRHDYASIYYRTNGSFNSVSGMDPEKPTIILLHPFLLDSSWLYNQFEDVRLASPYNLIAFDRRSSGNSKCRTSGSHDSWVDAADLAFCHHALHLPPCHILAFEGVAASCAARFATLFPEKCLSLMLCNIPAHTQHKWVNSSYREIVRNWCFADDLAALEQAEVDTIKLIIGNDCSSQLQDELIAYWQVHLPPTQRDRVLETFSVLFNYLPVKDEALATVTLPVLIAHGDKIETVPLKMAEMLTSKLVNAQDGAIMYPIKGGGPTLSLTPIYSVAHQVFSKFLARLPHVRSDLVPPEVPLEERMKTALLKLGEYLNDASVIKRDPLSPISFSGLPPDVVRKQNEMLAQYRKGKNTAFSPLTPEGRPIRRYSNRHRDHWFHGGKDGCSIASMDES